MTFVTCFFGGEGFESRTAHDWRDSYLGLFYSLQTDVGRAPHATTAFCHVPNHHALTVPGEFRFSKIPGAIPKL